jgi:adenylate cyclase
VSVKGRDAPVTIREIYQDLRGAELDRHRRLAEVFAPALKLYEHRQWSKAQQAFRACLEIVKEDVASTMFIERCAYYSANPPSEDWDGSFVMKSK